MKKVNFPITVNSVIRGRLKGCHVFSMILHCKKRKHVWRELKLVLQKGSLALTCLLELTLA